MRCVALSRSAALEAGHKTLPLVVPMLFTGGAEARIRYIVCWRWMNLPTPVVMARQRRHLLSSGRWPVRAGWRDYAAAPTGRCWNSYKKLPWRDLWGAVRTAGRPTG